LAPRVGGYSNYSHDSCKVEAHFGELIRQPDALPFVSWDINQNENLYDKLLLDFYSIITKMEIKQQVSRILSHLPKRIVLRTVPVHKAFRGVDNLHGN
jgi:hypothetical protein